MRDPQRIDRILALLEQLWRSSPDLRLGQIVVNAAKPSRPTPAIFYVEDDVIEVELTKLVDGVEHPSQEVD